MPDLPRPPISAPEAWAGSDLQRNPSAWTHDLSAADQGELAAAAEALRDRSLQSITRDSAPLPRLAPVLRGLRAQIQSGLGVVLVRGFPTEALALDGVGTELSLTAAVRSWHGGLSARATRQALPSRQPSTMTVSPQATR